MMQVVAKKLDSSILKGMESKNEPEKSSVADKTIVEEPEVVVESKKISFVSLSKNSLGASPKKNESNVNSSANRRKLPESKIESSLLNDHEVYQLTDLVNGDFDMPDTDLDYRLTDEQLIKVCKILLHKINYNQRRNQQDYQLVLSQMKGDLQQYEAAMRSSVEEVNQFL